MRSVLLIVASLLVAGVIAIGCLGKPRFECASAGDCLNGTIQGTCQPGGGCSFSDPSCPSGQRYGDLSEMANQCVPLPIDAMIDAYVHDAYVHDARECFGGSGAYQLCFDMMPPMGDVNLVGALDTGTDSRCMTPPSSWTSAGQPDACMILGKTVTIGTVTVTGAKPLIVVGDTIAISGTLDVASHRGQAAGPGAPFASCTAFPTAPLPNATGAGGGAGGSFMRKGGDGGNGNALGGTAPPALTVNPTVLRAGCSGQQGGAGGITPTLAGAPGAGGGAVYLTASRISFTNSGVINASGAGALAANDFTGGSGGGSGGMIVLHAAEMITATSGARMIANGGGASSGAADANAGQPGNDPSVAQPMTPATGGDAGNTSGAGGNGFAGGTAAERGENASGQAETGGGGGGGGGFIQSNVMITNIQSSPTLVVVP